MTDVACSAGCSLHLRTVDDSYWLDNTKWCLPRGARLGCTNRNDAFILPCTQTSNQPQNPFSFTPKLYLLNLTYMDINFKEATCLIPLHLFGFPVDPVLHANPRRQTRNDRTSRGGRECHCQIKPMAHLHPSVKGQVTVHLFLQSFYLGRTGWHPTCADTATHSRGHFDFTSISRSPRI